MPTLNGGSLESLLVASNQASTGPPAPKQLFYQYNNKCLKNHPPNRQTNSYRDVIRKTKQL